MQFRSVTLLAGLVALTVSVFALPVSAAQNARTLVRLNGIGPLVLGMTQAEAVATGWLGRKGTGCELAGPPLPVTYRFVGPKAPAGIKGFAEFNGGELTNLSFTGGVRTAAGVVPGKTTFTRMVDAYRDAGFRAISRFDETFQGTFVTVRRDGKQWFGAFAEQHVVSVLGLPFVPVCE